MVCFIWPLLILIWIKIFTTCGENQKHSPHEEESASEYPRTFFFNNFLFTNAFAAFFQNLWLHFLLLKPENLNNSRITHSVQVLIIQLHIYLSSNLRETPIKVDKRQKLRVTHIIKSWWNNRRAIIERWLLIRVLANFPQKSRNRTSFTSEPCIPNATK